NTLLRIIESHRTHQPEQSMLRRNVGRRAADRGHTLDRADNNDRAGTSLQHVGNGILGDQKAALQIDVEHLVPKVFARAHHIPVLLDTGIAYDNVDSTKALYDSLDRT